MIWVHDAHIGSGNSLVNLEAGIYIAALSTMVLRPLLRFAFGADICFDTKSFEALSEAIMRHVPILSPELHPMSPQSSLALYK
jgi:hypothetical protein